MFAKYDKHLVYAALIGALSTLVSELASVLLVLVGIGQQDMFSIDSQFVTLNRSSFFFGAMVEFVAGGTAGILLYLVLDRIGTSYMIAKGLMTASFFWFLFKLYTTAYIEGRYVDIRPMDTYMNHFISTLLFGLVISLAFKYTLFRFRKGKD